jgi:hypothetical protein
LVNFTGFDYLVYFKLKDKYFMKYLESGDSIPLSKKYDDAKMQIKMIDDEILNDYQMLGINMSRKDGNNYQFLEEIAVTQRVINDMRTEQNREFKNWSALVQIRILKEKLGMEESSYLSTGISKFTFIRKTKSDITVNLEEIIDINLMPPMIFKNCLPFSMKLVFKDSSEIEQVVTFQKEEEKNLFCFSMSKSSCVDIVLPEFETIKNFKIFNLEKYRTMEFKIPIMDRYGRNSMIYTKISR